MPIPTFGTIGTTLTGSNSTAASFAVPPSVAIGDIIVIPMYVEVAQAVTPSAGFVEAPNSPVTVTTQPHTLHVFWKRATAADAGTYAFTVAAGLLWRTGAAMRFTGCVRFGNPFEANATAIDNLLTNTATPAVSLTTKGPDRLLVWAASSSSGSSCATVSGFTERLDAGGLAADTLAKPAAGSSGSLSAAFTTAASMGVWLGALIPDPPQAIDNKMTNAVRRAGFY